MPLDYTRQHIVISFAGGVEDYVFSAFAGLPFSEGTCYDVHQRWQHALQSVQGKLNVSLELSYYSMYRSVCDILAAAILELEAQGKLTGIFRRRALAAFDKTSSRLTAGHMSIAELFQLAFAFEHLAPTPPHVALGFVSSVGRLGKLYDSMMDGNHAHELMTASTKPATRALHRIWTLMTDWLSASVVNFLTRVLLPRHACRWTFRRDLHLAESNLTRLKESYHLQRSSNLPYTAPPVVLRILPEVQKFLREEHTRHVLGQLLEGLEQLSL